MVFNVWTKETAEKYDAYATKYPLYRKTSNYLVKLAGIKKGMTVVDLGCGTGVTTAAILKKLGNSGKVIGIDISEAMLEVARRKIRQKNVCFIKSWSADMAGAIKEKADLVLCNQAFWQTKMPLALQAIYKILKDDGKFVFNLNEQFFKMPKGNSANFSLTNKMISIAREEYGIKAETGKFSSLDYSLIKRLLSENSFKIDSYSIIQLKKTIKEIYEFFKIPAMTELIFPGIEYSKRMAILDKAYKQVKKSEIFNERYNYFVTSKIV